MLLHGDKISVGDRVFDISANRGFGFVKRIYDNLIEVEFKRLKIKYNEEGIQNGKDWPTLFWTIPVVIKPNKDETMWHQRQQLVDKFLSIVDEYKDI